MEPTRVASLPPGTEFPLINRPIDAPSVYVDGMTAITADLSVAKMTFFERGGGADGAAAAKHVVTLVIGRALLTELSDRIADAIVQLTNAENAANGGQ